MRQSSSEPCGPDLFSFGIAILGSVLPVSLPGPGLVEQGHSEGTSAPPCWLFWLCSSDIPARFWSQERWPFVGQFGKMPDSKPNPFRVELLKEWLEDLLKPGYVNQRIASLKKALKKQNKASEVRVLIISNQQSSH